MDSVRFACEIGPGLRLSTWLILGGICLTLAIGAAVYLWMGQRAGWPPHLVRGGYIAAGVTVVALVGLLGVTWGLAPKALVLTDTTLSISRTLNEISIPLSTVTGARRLGPNELDGTIRTMGSDGVFARVGRFHSPALGNFRMYLTDTGNGVVVEAEERYVLSPDDPHRFLVELERRLGEAPP